MYTHSEKGMGRSQVDKAYQCISDMIFKYQISPGMSVSDYALSSLLGISRTPIRQAMMMLENNGLIVYTERSYKVPEITLKSIDDLYDARACLEVAILRVSMKKGIKPDEIAKLRQFVAAEDRCNTSGESLAGLEYDMDFHHYLNSLAKNDRLEASYENLHLQMKMLNVFSLANPNFNTPKVYYSIVEAIASGDVELACKRLEDSIEVGRKQKKSAIERFGSYGLQGIYTFIAQSYISATKSGRLK